MIPLTLDKVDRFVAKMQRKGIKVRWDGWDMVFFRQDHRAITSPKGRRYGGEWGFETVVSPNSSGKWLVSYRLTRGSDVRAR